MGTVFRRSFRDKKTGKIKHICSYSIKFQDASGAWVTEPTDAIQKHVALRFLRERELQVQQQLVPPSGSPAPATPPSIKETTVPRADAPVAFLEDLRDLYLPAVRLRLKPSTAKMYGEVLQFVLPRLSIRTAGELTLQHVEHFMQQRLASGVAPRTVNIQVGVLQRLLTWAVKQGLIAHNPLTGWQPLREVPRRKRRSMLPEEVRALLAAAPVHRRIVYAVFLATGVRRSELLQLERSDLDLEHGLLIVRPELTKSGKGRRVFLPQGLVDLLREYLARDVRERVKRQDAYLARIRKWLARLEEAGQGDSQTAERLQILEDIAVKARGHRLLFVNGKGLPIRRNCNLIREFRKDLNKAGVDPTGLDLHSLRHTTNTTLLRGGVNPSIIRARLGHTTARMTETYTDKEALDQGGETGPIATLLGLSDGTPTADGEKPAVGAGKGLTLDEAEILRPSGTVLAGLVARYSNVLIAQICRVSEAAVRKWLQRDGIVRTRRKVLKELTEAEVALLRADLRAALAAEAARKRRPAS
jgi:integrase